LKNWNNISKYIKILDILDDTYSKTKNSLDENITFTIWILKILEWYTSNEKNTEEKIINTNTVKQEKKEEKQIIDIIQKAKKEELKVEDIWDIFWWNELVEEKNQAFSSSNSIPNFDTNTFITKLKENWIKSANINTLKNSELSLDNNILNIKTTNAFLKKTIDKEEVITLFSKVVTDMWIEDPKINIT
jgi:hypothetical protein